MPLRRRSWPLPPEPDEQPDGYDWMEILLVVLMIFFTCLGVVYVIGRQM